MVLSFNIFIFNQRVLFSLCHQMRQTTATTSSWSEDWIGRSCSLALLLDTTLSVPLERHPPCCLWTVPETTPSSCSRHTQQSSRGCHGNMLTEAPGPLLSTPYCLTFKGVTVPSCLVGATLSLLPCRRLSLKWLHFPLCCSCLMEKRMEAPQATVTVSLLTGHMVCQSSVLQNQEFAVPFCFCFDYQSYSAWK